MNNATEHNLIFRDTFEDAAGTLIADHAPDFGGSAGDWYKISTGGHDAKIDAGGDDLIVNGVTGVQHAIDLSLPPKQIQYASASTGTPTILGLNAYFRMTGTENADLPDGTLTLQYSNVFGTIALNISVMVSGTPSLCTGQSASVPTTDMFSSQVSFAIQDDGRYIRYWIVGEETNTLRSYDTLLDSRINAFGGKSIGIGFNTNSACEIGGIECHG